MIKDQQNNKRLAKNSAFMYVQMGIKMLISLYTVRYILHALGAEDYGIYNVVGGIVTMFSFITSTLVSASMRFFAYAIGKGEYGLLNRYFNSSIVCFLVLSVILFVIIEPVGYWFVNNKMVVPDSRLETANWVLQFSIIAFIIRILAVPFKALVVAFEKMIVFAIISVLDSFLLLGVAFLLLAVHADRLFIYSLCMLGISFISTLLYIILCRTSFPRPSKIKLCWERKLLHELLNYCGWYMFGTVATVVRSQGINMLLNVFFNPVVNAARAISYQINNAINQFVNAFYQAVRPQITKLTAAEEYKRMLSLVYNSSVISFMLMCLVAVPLLVELPFVLSVWLKEVPEYTVVFARLVIITAMIDTLGYPLQTAICSSGHIKYFQITIGTILILNLPISYIFLYLYSTPYLVFYISIILSVVAQIARIVFMHNMYDMPVLIYFKQVILRVLFVVIVSLAFTILLNHAFNKINYGSFITILLSVMAMSVISFYCGLNKSQRSYVVAFVRSKIQKKDKNIS